MDTEVLDQTLEKDPHVFTTTEGTIFGNLGAVALCGVIVIMGCALVSSLNVFAILGGCLMVALGLCGLTFRYGIEVDINNNRHREFSSLLGIKFGKWKSLLHYPYITILSINESKRVYSSMVNSTTYKDEDLGIYILNKSHYQKILIEKHDHFEAAMKRANFFSEKMQKEVVTYNPVRISNRK